MKKLFAFLIMGSFLLFNSCQKTRELFFATKMEGKVIDLQSGKGIPNANLNVYRMSSYYNNFIKIAAFKADEEGNFEEKIRIKISKEEKYEDLHSYILKAEPIGYERTFQTSFPVSGSEFKPWIHLNLNHKNENIEFKLLPEYQLEVTFIDLDPIFIDQGLTMLVYKPVHTSRYQNILYPHTNPTNSVFNFLGGNHIFNTMLPKGDYDIILRGYNFIVNPHLDYIIDSVRINLDGNSKISFNY